jgi:hypothetical protein
LPRRSAKIQKFDPSFEKKEKPKRKYTHRTTVDGEKDDGYSSDGTVPASPITLSKIIKPQEHQDDFHDDKKFYLKKRRSRRGRPKRDEYIYVCDEKCSYCYGPWGEILANGETNQEERVDDERKLEPIDIELLDNDEVRLVRCKDCRMAFHPACMRMNGGEVKVSEGKGVTKSEEVQQDDISSKTANVGADESGEAGTEVKAESVADAVDSEKSICPMTGTDEAELESEALESNEPNDPEEVAGPSEATKVSAEAESDSQVIENSEANSEMGTSAVSASAEENTDVSLKEEDIGSTNEKSLEIECSDETTQIMNGEEPKRRRPPRIPKRCCKCDLMRQMGIEPSEKADQDIEETQSSDDLAAPVKTKISFKLEAIVDGKTVLCGVNPAPTLVADVDGKSVLCHIWFNVGSEHEKRVDESHDKPTVVMEEAQTRKRKSKALVTKPKDPIARKVEKIATKATNRIMDAKVQTSSIDELQKLVDGATTTAAAVRAGGLEVLVNAMENHPEKPNIQAKSIKTMTEIVWYCQSLGIDLIEAGCLELATDAMDVHGRHVEIQQLGVELFRALSSFDLECCKAMFEADIVRVVMSTIKCNPDDLVVLTEAR